MSSTDQVSGFGRLLHVVSLAFVSALAIIGAVVVAVVGSLWFEPSMAQPSATPVALAVTTNPHPKTPEELYLDLLKRTLTRAQVTETYERHPLRPGISIISKISPLFSSFLWRKGLELARIKPAEVQPYMDASDFNLDRLEDGETMVGLRQLDNVQFCVTDAIHRKVPGDMIEAGAWRGGVTILMAAVLKAYGERGRKVWVADSFEGLPDFDRQKNTGWQPGTMAVSLEEARTNFQRYGLLDDNVQFLKGFFANTLPTAPIGQLAVFRSDADLYESTRDALTYLYPKLSVGGYAIFDDYSDGCRRATDEYRASHHITEEVHQIDSLAIYWMRER